MCICLFPSIMPLFHQATKRRRYVSETFGKQSQSNAGVDRDEGQAKNYEDESDGEDEGEDDDEDDQEEEADENGKIGSYNES